MACRNIIKRNLLIKFASSSCWPEKPFLIGRTKASSNVVVRKRERKKERRSGRDHSIAHLLSSLLVRPSSEKEEVHKLWLHSYISVVRKL